MIAPEHEPSCAVRGLLGREGEVRLVTRTLVFTAAGQTSLAPEAAHPSALDLLISALVADLLAGLQREAARAGIAIHDAELNVAAELDNPLVALGVVGEAGSAALRSIRGSLYVSSNESLEAIEPLWRRSLERAPVYSTLRRCADITIELKPVT